MYDLITLSFKFNIKLSVRSKLFIVDVIIIVKFIYSTYIQRPHRGYLSNCPNKYWKIYNDCAANAIF